MKIVYLIDENFLHTGTPNPVYVTTSSTYEEVFSWMERYATQRWGTAWFWSRETPISLLPYIREDAEFGECLQPYPDLSSRRANPVTDPKPTRLYRLKARGTNTLFVGYFVSPYTMANRDRDLVYFYLPRVRYVAPFPWWDVESVTPIQSILNLKGVQSCQ